MVNFPEGKPKENGSLPDFLDNKWLTPNKQLDFVWPIHSGSEMAIDSHVPDLRTPKGHLDLSYLFATKDARRDEHENVFELEQTLR